MYQSINLLFWPECFLWPRACGKSVSLLLHQLQKYVQREFKCFKKVIQLLLMLLFVYVRTHWQKNTLGHNPTSFIVYVWWQRVSKCCYNVRVLEFYSVTVLQCYCVTVLRCYGVTMLRCYGVTVLRCYRVMVLQCYGVTVLRCYSVMVLRCYGVTW